jgi:hypothetical protein
VLTENPILQLRPNCPADAAATGSIPVSLTLRC